jgi:hypothetical protein
MKVKIAETLDRKRVQTDQEGFSHEQKIWSEIRIKSRRPGKKTIVSTHKPALGQVSEHPVLTNKKGARRTGPFSISIQNYYDRIGK